MLDTEIIDKLKGYDAFIETPECIDRDVNSCLAKAAAIIISLEQSNINSYEYLDNIIFRLREEIEAIPNIGDTISFGRYKQGKTGEVKPIEWIVLDEELDFVLLVSKKALEYQPYIESNTSFKNIGESPSWTESYLRKFLNTVFLSEAFSDNEKNRITERVWFSDSKHADAFPDKIICLSESDLRFYMDNFTVSPTDYVKSLSIECNGNGCCKWWLLNNNQGCTAYLVNSMGLFSSEVYAENNNCAVRPAIYLNI